MPPQRRWTDEHYSHRSRGSGVGSPDLTGTTPTTHLTVDVVDEQTFTVEAEYSPQHFLERKRFRQQHRKP